MPLRRITNPNFASLQLGLVELTMKCVGAGAADPTGLEGDAESVARDAAGTYTFQLPGEGSLDIRDVRPSIKQGATLELVPFFDYDETARTVTIVVKDATNATPFTDTDLTSSEVLHVSVLVKN